MTRYFKQYIDSTKEVEISRARAIKGLGLVYRQPAWILRYLPLGYRLRVGWCYYKKVQTK